MYITKYKAKSIEGNQWFEGAYFQVLKTPTLPLMPGESEEERGKLEKENTGHYIVFYEIGDWNMPNEPKIVEIDPLTLRALEEEWKV